MNHHCVPDFEMDEEYSPFPITTPPSASCNAKKFAMGEEEIMELLWENGQVVVHTQNQRSVKKSHVDDGDAAIPVPAGREVRSVEEEMATSHQHLFMQEDEMASWLHYPLVESPIDRYLSADLLYLASSSPASATAAAPRDIRPSAPEIRGPLVPSTAAPLPPIPPGNGAPRFQNFGNFPRLSRPRIKPPGPSRESTVVESNDTPIVRRVADSTAQVSGGNLGCGGGITSETEAAGTSTGAKEITTTCELTVMSSPDDGSGASVSAEKSTPPATTEDRKRKRSETDEEGHNAETDFGSADHAKKQTRRVSSSSSKRSRAAEVHNLSERKRRDRINEKMRALQELIPRCNKSDKASVLDEAIEYLKSLQLQVQMMSLGHGCGMIPMMFPGIQQYIPAMGIRIGMGMGMGMNRPVAPYPTVPNVAAATPMGPRFPMMNSLIPHNANQPPFSSAADPYKQNLGLHQAQVASPMQNQMVEQPINKKPSSSSSSKDVENPATLQCG